MRVTPIPCLKDNYAYLVTCEESGDSIVVDPSEAAPVIAAVDAARARVVAIYNTHHHWDHVGGNEELAKKYGIKNVYGHTSDDGRIPGQTKKLDEGDKMTMGMLDVSILHIPGHTTGAIAYVVKALGESPVVFTGDTLFLGGCGRLFEGTPAMMHESLSKLAALPPETRVFCGHEYTESNLRFAAHVEPSNADVAAAQKLAKETRGRGEPTVPGTLAHELKVNPFLRVASAEIRAKLDIAPDADAATALGAIRKAKDDFK